MAEIDLRLPPGRDAALVEREIDEACAAYGLTTRLKTTLGQYPGGVHWHLRSGRLSGTLEITLWPEGGRLWFSVRANRSAGWIDEAVAALGEDISRRLAS